VLQRIREMLFLGPAPFTIGLPALSLPSGETLGAYEIKLRPGEFELGTLYAEAGIPCVDSDWYSVYP
jgi:hypothetical protein